MNKSVRYIVILMLFISGLDITILTSIFPTIVVERNFIKDHNIYLISFFISFLVSFNVFYNSGKIINIISSFLNIISSIGLFFSHNSILFILIFISLKSLAIGSNISLACHILSNKDFYKIQNIKREIISISVGLSLIIGSLLSILIKWIDWKILYLFTIPLSACVILLLLCSKHFNNQFTNKSYFLKIDYTGIFILYSYLICIYFLNETTYDNEPWKYYIVHFSFPTLCAVFFILTEIIYEKNAILPIKLNLFYLFSFCFGFNYVMDTNKLSFLFQIIHEFSIIQYEFLMIALSIFAIFLIVISLILKKLNRLSPIFCISLSVIILFVNSHISYSFNISTPKIILIVFVLLNVIAFSFIMTNLYILVKDSP